MADEAFALSPISARATQPSEQDYDAISEAFMETSRGRWFLGEYAKRNRNADTRMVLDAVARIEENLAVQRQPAAENRLVEALAAIRSAVDEARTTATEAVDRPVVEENLAPVRKGTRIIREIAWRWREIGADSRICDLLDSQVNAIEAACEQIASNAPPGALSAAFDLIGARIAEFGDGAAAQPPAEEANPSPSPAAPDEIPAATAVSAAADEATAEGDDVSAEAADAYDESVLDLIALEMAAPDSSDLDDISEMEPDEIQVAELPPAEPIVLAQQPETIPAPPPIEPSLQPVVQPSLGSSLLASGIVRRPKALESDPLAPIRRMSQAEKIAFFS
jgi:hypothetical protein